MSYCGRQLKGTGKIPYGTCKGNGGCIRGNLNIEQYRTSLNRSYYAIFHAMRAVNILEGYDSSKHSGVIAYFTQTFLKTERLDRGLSKIIKEASYLREKSDYTIFI